jgi:nitrite reductase/ring-hydroxylating ferredoxin subunit
LAASSVGNSLRFFDGFANDAIKRFDCVCRVDGSAVVGESIVCPFHGWAYDGDGKCTSMPYAKNMPPKVARGGRMLTDKQLTFVLKIYRSSKERGFEFGSVS